MGKASALDGAIGVYMSFVNHTAPTCKQSSAQEILSLLDELEIKSSQVLDRTSTKLNGFMQVSPTEESKIGSAFSSMPPYFDALRMKIEGIRRNIYAIDDCIVRTDT